jgi:hypothetical protein
MKTRVISRQFAIRLVVYGLLCLYFIYVVWCPLRALRMGGAFSDLPLSQPRVLESVCKLIPELSDINKNIQNARIIHYKDTSLLVRINFQNADKDAVLTAISSNFRRIQILKNEVFHIKHVSWWNIDTSLQLALYRRIRGEHCEIIVENSNSDTFYLYLRISIESDWKAK